MGVVKIESNARPDRAIHLNGERVYWPPAGCISSTEAARRIGITDAQLRAMRTAKDAVDRGPIWVTAPNHHHVAYLPSVVDAYIRARALAMKTKAEAMLARVEQAKPAEQAVDAGAMS
jgi:hypothetical protein